MKPQDDLYDLVKSLTKAEKTYITKVAKGFSKKDNPSYLDLIEILDSMKEFDEKIFIKKTQHINNLSYLKNYTYHFILEHLVKANLNSYKYLELNNEASACKILFDKGLYEQCEKNIKRIKKEAEEYGYFDIIYNLNLIQEKISREELHLDKILENIDQSSQAELIRIMEVTNQLKVLYAELSCYTLKNPDQHDDSVNINKKKAKELIALYKHEQNVELLRWLLQLEVMLNVLNRSIKSFSVIKKTLKFYEKHPNLLKENFNEYMMLNTLYSFIFCKVNHHSAALEQIQFLKTLIINEQLNLTDQLRKKFLQRTNNFFINHTIENGYWDLIDDQIDVLIAEFNTNEKSLGSLDYMWFCHFVSYYYFTLNQYSIAHRWIYKMIHSPFYAERKMSHMVTRVYLLFLQYELKNHDYLASALKNEKRYVDKIGIGDEMEAVIISHLEKAIRLPDQEKLHLQLLKEVLSQKAFKKKLTANILDFFNVFAWLESKIKNKPLRACFESSTILQPAFKLFLNPDLNLNEPIMPE
jgi:hypothetical protein